MLGFNLSSLPLYIYLLRERGAYSQMICDGLRYVFLSPFYRNFTFLALYVDFVNEIWQALSCSDFVVPSRMEFASLY